MAVIAALLFSFMIMVSWMGNVLNVDAQRFEHRRMTRSYGLAGELERFEQGEGPVDWVLETCWDRDGFSIQWPGSCGGKVQLMYVASWESRLVYFDSETGEGWTYDDTGERVFLAEEDLAGLRAEALGRIRAVTGVREKKVQGRALVMNRWRREKAENGQWILVKKNP